VNPERARLFVALELPEPVRAALGQWRADRIAAVVAGLRMVSLDSLHVTLCFLGSVPVEEIGSIAAACELLSGHERPVLTVGDPAWLPPRRPRVLAVDLDDQQGALGGLQAELSTVLARGGWYEPEQRPFRAHVTVARVAARTRVAAVELPPPAPITFVGSSVLLMRSRTGRGGARYEPLAVVELGSDPSASRPSATAEAASRSTSPAPDRSRS
jgi:RNA 2',3'-cyclic 3'-phosphodiesterase